jgi:hypothetical protein
MDETEQQINDLIRSTERSNREYNGQCIDEDIKVLLDIEECLNQLDFEVQRWAILFLAYRWRDARAKPHDDRLGIDARMDDTAMLRSIMARRLQAYGAFEGCTATDPMILTHACLAIVHLTGGEERRRLYLTCRRPGRRGKHGHSLLYICAE